MTDETVRRNALQQRLFEANTPKEIFIADTIEKKRIARNAGKKVGAGGRKVTFGYDLLSNKDKKKYMEGSALTSYNVKNVISYHEFNKYPKNAQKEMIEYWINNKVITKGNLMKYWKKSFPTMEMLFTELDIQITNPDLIRIMENMKRVQAEMTPEKRAESEKRRLETRERNKRIREAEEADRRDEEVRKENERIRQELEAERLAEEEKLRVKEERKQARIAEAAARAEEMEKLRMEMEILRARATVQQPTSSTYNIPLPALADRPGSHVHATVNQLLNDTHVEPQPIEPTAQDELPMTMSFNIDNRSGVVCLNMINKMISFMNGDTKTMYKVGITIEEVK